MPNFDPETTEFLDAQKNAATRNVYRCALEAFQDFYAPQGTIRDFLLRVEADEKAPTFVDQKRLALRTMNDFVDWMKITTDYKGKTIKVYAGAVQSLIKYLIKDARISTRYSGIPDPREDRKPYPWNIESVSKFAQAINHPLYRCLIAVFFQSGISLSDVLTLTYGDIKTELETENMPLCLDLARTKKDNPYMTFVGSLGCRLLKEYAANRGTWEKKDPLFPVDKSSIERYFVRRAKKLPGIYDNDHLYGPQSLRSGFRTAMQDSGLKQQFIGFFMGSRLFVTKEIYKSKSKEGWRAEYASHQEAVAFRLPCKDSVEVQT